MPAKVEFFDPEALLCAGFGEIQTHQETESAQRGQGLKADGDENASHYYDHRSARSETYKAFAANGSLSLPGLGGAPVNGYHLDQWSLAFSPTDWPTLTIDGHRHNSQAHPATRAYAHGLTVAAGWGIPRNVGGIALGEADAAIGIASATLAFSVTHQDELDGAGEHLASEDRDGVLTLTVTFTGVPSALTGPSGWDDNADGATGKGNTQADTYTRSWQKHVAFTPADAED